MLQRGLFPETLPPCFTSTDLRRAFGGIVNNLKANAFHNRPADYVRYNGTKHDGSRRYFGSPNPISYFHVASFIAEHWATFATRLAGSPFSVSQPRIAAETDDRPVVVPSLSQLTTIASKQIGHAGYILKTDIAQFFPSIYTHSISWSAHGIDGPKGDTDPKSQAFPFNQLDFFVRNCQRAETRGLIVGPDAFRLIAEFIAAGLDTELDTKIRPNIIGAARHVDDYYIGLRGEPDALVTLSALRDTLQRYSLNINDAKTRIMRGVEPLNDLWAQELRIEAGRLNSFSGENEIIYFINKAFSLASQFGSDSPVKIALRRLDQIRIYSEDAWQLAEPYLQRAIFHHPHCIDYVCLLVVKRFALGRPVAAEGWKSAAWDLLKRHLPLNHHHEILWLSWLLLSTGMELSEQLVGELSACENAHVRALVIAAFQDKRIARKPPVRLGGKLATTDANWLVNLVGRSTGYSGAAFSGLMADEFGHLASKKVKLIDFKAPVEAAKRRNAQAISRTRYGYDGDGSENDDEDEDDHDDELDAEFWDRLNRDNT